MKHKHEDYKMSAVLYYKENDSSLADTCRIFKCSERSLKRWIDRYDDEQEFKRHNRPPIAYKVKKEWVIFARKKLKENPQITIEELAGKLKQQFHDFNISRKHLGDVIRDINETRKRTRRKHFPMTKYNKPIDFQTEMNKFFAVVDKYPLNKIISIDETSIAFYMSPEYSRCYLGTRCEMKTTDNKVFQKHTLISAISSTGLIGYIFYNEGGMTTERLIEFLTKILENRKNYLVVLDNAPAHRKKIVKQTIEESGNKLVYAVPYTPRTNPVENWFSQLKHYMKLDRTLTIPEVRTSIRNAIKRIKPESYLHIFQYAYRRDELRKYEKKVSTLYRKPKTYK